MRILHRHPIFFYVMAFSCFQLIFVHLLESLSQGVSGLDLILLQKNILKYKWFVGFAGLTLISVNFYWKRSKLLLGFYFLMVGAYSIKIFIINYDKFILSLTFFSVIFSYFIYLNWEQALRFACYNSKMTKADLEVVARKKIICLVEYDGIETEMFLTNWDNIGCFLCCDNFKLKKHRSCKLVFEVNGRKFSNTGKIVSLWADKGIGILFDYNENMMSWSNFQQVLDERGFIPELIVS